MGILNPTQRAQLLAASAGIAAILTADDDERARAQEKPVVSRDPAACTHPSDQREPAPTMGTPDRTICKRCGAVLLSEEGR